MNGAEEIKKETQALTLVTFGLGDDEFLLQ